MRFPAFISAFLWVTALMVVVLAGGSIWGKQGHSMNAFVLLFVVWALLSVATPVVLLVRLAYKKGWQQAFLYQALCVANGELALYGMWAVLHGNMRRDVALLMGALLVNLCLAVIMLIDIFLTRPPVEHS